MKLRLFIKLCPVLVFSVLVGAAFLTLIKRPDEHSISDASFFPVSAEMLKLKEVYEWKRRELNQLIADSKCHVEQDDPILIDIIREEHIKGPAEGDYPKVLFEIRDNPKILYGGQFRQSYVVDKYFKEKRNGFFIEAGAWNGAYLSNSLYLEMERNWTGLLVEGNSNAFIDLTNYGRKAFSMHGCLSVTNSSGMVDFDGADVFGGIKKTKEDQSLGERSLERNRAGLPPSFRNTFRVTCFPVYSLLLALGNPKVDYFSLDVEGSELEILRTIPWDRVQIETFTIEVEHSDPQAIIQLMESKGYKVEQRIDRVDIFFVKNKY